MRLLNAATHELHEFTSFLPQYAILSHTWGEEEVTLGDVRAGNAAQLKGWEKITWACQVALQHKFQYIWIDTCCIDKTSSAELSEAINSMFQWYGDAKLCIAYLSDVHPGAASKDDLKSSRWFKRGWTLQELIAPAVLVFFDAHWNQIASKKELKTTIHAITGIPSILMERDPFETILDDLRELLGDYSVAQKFSWASNRITTRPEDLAYCLLGLFDINMPLLYGEGQKKAFRRLQEEIIRSTDDDSIFAWTAHNMTEASGLLAETPTVFGNLDSDFTATKRKYVFRRSNMGTIMSNRGLTVNLSLTPLPGDTSGSLFVAFLDCDVRIIDSTTTLSPAILVQRTSWDDDAEFVRARPYLLVMCMMNRILLPNFISDIIHGSAPASDTQDPHLMLEPLPREIFVSNKPSASRIPHGMLFYPKVGGSSEYTISVLSRSPTWQHFANSPSDDNGCYEVNFDIAPMPDVCAENKAALFGAIELLIQSEGRKDVWHVCVVAGLEPLGKNPLAIKGRYPVPWASFADPEVVKQNAFEGLLDGSARTSSKTLDHTLYVMFDTERRYSRLFYRLRLVVDNPQVESKSRWKWN